KDAHRAHKRARSTLLCEDNLSYVDVPRQESGLAIGEIVLPQPPESIVEAELGQARPGRAEIVSPGRKLLGIFLPEDAPADVGVTESLAKSFEDLGRRQHAAGEDVALDEVDFAAIGLEHAVLNGDGLDTGEPARQQPIPQLRKVFWPELLANCLNHLDR